MLARVWLVLYLWLLLGRLALGERCERCNELRPEDVEFMGVVVGECLEQTGSLRCQREDDVTVFALLDAADDMTRLFAAFAEFYDTVMT